MSSNQATARADREIAVHWVTLERSRSVAAVLLDPGGGILRCNGLFREIVGEDQLVESANLAAWLEDEESWSAVMDRSRSGLAEPVRLSIERAGKPRVSLQGELIETAIEAAAPCVIGLFTNVAELDSARSVLARNARLEALVCLTTGVAHDFNNLLTVLSGNLALAAEEVRHVPKTFAKLKAARDAAGRGGELIRQLLAFARQKEIGSELIDPVRIVRSIAPLVERALGSKIELVLDLDESAGQIHASAVQFESAIVNLAVNARDALGEGGKVRIAVAAEPGPGADVVTTVADNGPGIPADLLDRIREPFFTTKAGSGGTGLGLSMVDTFARQHGGHLRIESEPGRGSRMSLVFPRAGDRLDESIAATMPLLALPSGSETIVAVARDSSVLGTIEQILTVLGYNVCCATGLKEAGEAIRAQRPDLIVADGFDVKALLNVCPPPTAGGACRGLELIAHAEQREEADRGGEDARVLRVGKPFSLPDFARGVRKALDRSV